MKVVNWVVEGCGLGKEKIGGMDTGKRGVTVVDRRWGREKRLWTRWERWQEGGKLHSKCKGPAAGPEKLAHCRTGVKGPITGEKGPES